MEGNASRQQGARKVWMGGSEAQNLRLDCAPLNILSRVHFKVLNTPQCTGNNIIRTELYMRSFATCNTAYGSPWKRSVGWLQERVLAPSSWHWPSEPQKTRAPALVATQFSHYRSLLTMKISSISWGIIGCKIIMVLLEVKCRKRPMKCFAYMIHKHFVGGWGGILYIYVHMQ